MINKFFKKIFGDQSERSVRPLWNRLKTEINPISEEILTISNDELRARIDKVRDHIRGNAAEYKRQMDELRAQIESLDYDKRESLWKKIDDLREEMFTQYARDLDAALPEVFAVVKETARRFKENETIEVTATEADRQLARQGKDFITIDGDKAIYKHSWMAGGNLVTWDMMHYDVQLIGGMVLHGITNNGKVTNNIAEMATGEGKTLVATLPVFLNALTGEGVHVVTVNDYLAKRDSEWMGPLYQFHGLTVACIDKTEPNSEDRRQAYACDITFGTNNEFGFDYLRDNMAVQTQDLVQREEHYYAIVDEVDSVLIDDARTPLIISGPVPKGDDQMFNEFKPNVEKVVNAQRKLAQQLLLEAKEKISAGDLENGGLALFRVYKALPKHGPLIRYLSEEGIKPLLLKVEAKYMADNNREMPVAVEPLYFVIDEKNHSIELTDKGIEVLSGTTTDPDFFILPDIASQLSAVENEQLSADEKREKKDNLLQNYSIKSERVHTVNQLLKAYTLFDKDVEYVIDDNKIKIVDEQTGRIMEGRRYSDGLHQAIEAKEGVKVEAATQTYATITLQNYFRMYRKLAGMTGTAMTEAGEFYDIYKLDVIEIPTNRPVIRNDMNDRVYRTKKEKYAAVIQEIEDMIAVGRPVLVGTTSVEISELLSKMLKLRKIDHQVLNAKLHQKEAEIVALAGQKGTVTIATNMAGRGTDIKLSPEVKAAGGLAIIGTERHESRRVDRQLRGRAGRQGDPGSSVFFVSFEDTVMRLFANDRVVKMLDRLGFKEGEMIENSMVTKSIENAQKRVEENNFGIRKRLVEYDDVMNAQRRGVYSRRQNALKGERIGVDIANMVYELSDSLASTRFDSFESFSEELNSLFAIEVPFTEAEYGKLDEQEISARIAESVLATMERKKEKLCAEIMPYVKDFVEEKGAKGPIGVPMTDGRRMFNIRADIEECYNNGCKPLAKAWEKAVLLSSIDSCWQEQLREMDELRKAVQNATYEQKDPLVIYKIEAYNIWEKMLVEMNSKSVSTLMRGRKAVPDYEDSKAAEKAAEEARRKQEEERRRRPVYAQPRNASITQAPAGGVPNPYAGYSTTRETYEGETAQRQAAMNANRGGRPVTQPIKAQPKVGRNDPCPCGSGKKYKNCCGRGQ
ncbi:MAG: preprotein translocase subunit SecA [Muribaculaceae bacterium]|nr:preprotein translocase subunit SecA [Bacteroidales bacterium]MDY4649180.1 preprotein translocase subunit SecA [Muribaculaceae bacterium]MDY5387745.1 preprotein translocase subunit SecA [Muribaculaceae bacterium]